MQVSTKTEQELMLMKPVIDIHSHMLPGVDDGCESKEEALAMLKMYENQNVEAVVCTPHYGSCGIPNADVNGTFDWLASTGSPVKLYLGNEILFTRSTLMDVRRKRAMPLAGSKYVLIEFEEWAYNTSAEDILNGVAWLAQSEYVPILAHPERYHFLRSNPNFCEKISKNGVKFQINAYDICENSNELTKSLAQRLLKKRLVSFIGSDAHGAERRSPALQTGVKWIYDHCPEDYADAIVHDNAAKILKAGGA